ncbi:mediator of RNA polymerase II transcription subunit 7-like [Tachypleus tridentatus]|uniref:mediator of RNA polymerase II transcription subunit 7-like n=1 Tax=Tachypleus tridentatus TaxID=6853 RepID=UPI003FD4ECAF
MSESTQVSSLPLPPMQYVNWYTDENIERGVAPSPPRPVQESYSMFGVQFQTDDVIIRPLETQGIRRLYPQNYDHKRELKKLNHSILVNFLDLLDILIRCPDTSKREEKQDDIRLLFIHVHHLINEFRPHQARRLLRVMLEVQKRQRLETAERFQKHLDKVRELLQNTLSSLPETADLDSMPTEFLDTSDTQGKPDAETEDCHRLDKLMCNIIDTL